MTSTEHFLHRMGSPVVRHGIDEQAEVEYLIEVWADDDWRVQSRPIGADGWQQWSPPVALTEVAPGSKPSAPDWSDNNHCGGGLHFSPSPTRALAYNQGATRFVEVGVKVADLRPIPGGTAKCKAPRVVRACREVTIDGKRVAS